ncbi:radical SAM protein with 4Fe4S-binding SPASM domain [Anaerosolibacter carboniphilus]|uniref:Radical SAM protein with 4Fe4S-binding SPASM domain n=1 Tax=Anaerosolibacter carboniphilus TaxID=1417629 RepID=A0A841L4S0_9FIRM|nr:radical SAM protein [Anaerosolibacter carboniphilus]MBB6218112.1 radical SAM protein with 4Fe4S-binding SPASM domain [Anaerosolibacter carboniphilus]
MEEIEIQLDIEKQYAMPKYLVVRQFEDKILVISPESANWLVLENDDQLLIFNELKNNSVEDVIAFMEERNIEEEDLIHVLTELEAKKFEDNNITLPQRNGLCIYLTDECNLRCKHCYMYSGTKKNNELTTAEILSLLDNFKKYNGEVVTFTGGEVALRADLTDILNYSKGLGLKNTLLTNGLVWSDELIDRATPFIDEIQISIDGYDEKSNAQIRGNGNFEKVLLVVDKLVKRGLKVAIAITPTFEELKENKDKYIEFGKMLIQQYNDKHFYIKFNAELLDGRDIEVNEVINNEYSELMKYVINSCYPESYRNEFILNHENNTVFDNCGYGGITVSSDGDIYFCNRIHELRSYGNLRFSNFDEIMNLSKMAMELSNINKLRPCCDCDLKNICGGGCRIKYFKDLIELSKLEKNSYNSFKPRKCDAKEKEKYYKLMIETNEDFYR